MRCRLVVANLAAALVTAFPPHSARALQSGGGVNPSESRIPIGSTSLYARAIGQGPPVIVLHGGPDFDHGYLLPTWIDSRKLPASSTTISAAAGDPLKASSQMK